MFVNLVFSTWARVTRTIFRIGMWFVRLSAYSLARNTNSVGTQWEVRHWTYYTCPLKDECLNRYTTQIRDMLWFLAEPHPDHAGSIPWSQHALLIEMVASHWSGGRNVAVVQLVADVMAAEDLVVD